MPIGGYKIRNQSAIHFITFAVSEWVDVFTRKEYRDIVLPSGTTPVKVIIDTRRRSRIEDYGQQGFL